MANATTESPVRLIKDVSMRRSPIRVDDHEPAAGTRRAATLAGVRARLDRSRGEIDANQALTRSADLEEA